ncbi:MAG: hypothetical protein VYB65_01460 [Myxococcota bacterium]|nr:hypothetical protein [Myxococcota bacterium]
MKPIWALGLTLLMTLLLGCESGDGAGDAPQADTGPATEADASMEPAESGSVFTHKMIKQIGENPFASLAYECPECTFEQWASIDPPEGWTKGPAQVAVFSEQHSTLRSYPVVEGHSDSVNFLDDVPGDEYRLIAINHSGRLVEHGPAGIVAEVQVQRDTLLVFTTGMRVHELTDPEGNVFVLFAHHVDTDDLEGADFQSEDALAYFTAPTDWTYSTRTLDEDLALDSNNHDGVVTVLAIRGPVNSTWEKR